MNTILTSKRRLTKPGTYHYEVESVKIEGNDVTQTVHVGRPLPCKVQRVPNNKGHHCNGLHAWMKARAPHWVTLHTVGELSPYAIAERYGVSRSAVRKALIKAGVYVRSPHGGVRNNPVATKNPSATISKS